MGVPKRVATEPKATAPPQTTKGPRKTDLAEPQPLTTPNRLAPGLVGARLRQRRMERGISLRQFARDIEVSASFISQLETGKAQPSVATFFSICAALDISTDELFNYDDSIESTREDSASGPTDAANNHWLAMEQGEETPATIRPHLEGGSSPVVRPNERRVLVLDSGVT